MGSYEYETFGIGPVAPLFVKHVGAATSLDQDLTDALGRPVVLLTLHGTYQGKLGTLVVALRVDEAALMINAIRLSAEHNGVWLAVQAQLDQITTAAKDQGWTLYGPTGGAGG